MFFLTAVESSAPKLLRLSAFSPTHWPTHSNTRRVISLAGRLALACAVVVSSFLLGNRELSADEPANTAGVARLDDQSLLSPTDWPQWRGPGRDGYAQAGDWPESIGPNQLQPHWQLELGPSYSGPIVIGNRVITTETQKAKFERVISVNRETGAADWEARWEGSLSVPFFAAANGSWIRSTPASDGTSVFIGGIRDVLVCLDLVTGAERWRVDLKEKFKAPLPTFGFVCSPLIDGDFVYAQAGGGCVKLDKRTGEVIWRTLEDSGGMNGSAFSSPILTSVGGETQLIVQTREQLAGVRPDDGKVLWSEKVPAFRGMNILTPVPWDHDTFFTSTYQNGSFLYRVNGGAVEQQWKNKIQGYMSSPIRNGRHVYLHLQNQRFACLDLETGKETWISKPYGKYWSMVARGDKILALDETGQLRLIRMNPEKFELLDEQPVTTESAWAHLAVAGSDVFVRDLKALRAFRWQP